MALAGHIIRGVPEPISGPTLRLLILDLDGVVYRGNTQVPGAAELVERLRRRGVAVRFATNNSMFTRRQYARRLTAMGIPAEVEEIVTSTVATAEHLRRHEPSVRTVMAVGAPGMVEELSAAGFAVIPVAEAAAQAAAQPGDAAPLVDAVVVGLDPAFDAARRATAVRAIRSGARFFATNVDARYPTPTGFEPGAGTVVAAIRDDAGVEPIVIGKPKPAMFEAVLEAAGVTPAEAVVVGDNADADIVGARRAGIESILVLTGVTEPAMVAGLAADRRPDHVAAGPSDVWRVVEARLSR